MLRFFCFLFLVIPLTGFSLTNEEKLAREEVLNQYGNGEETYQEAAEVEATEPSSTELNNISKPSATSAPIKLDTGKDNFLTKFMSDDIKKKVAQMMTQNPFRLMGDREVRSFIFQRVEGKPAGAFLKNNPRLLNAIVEFIRDDKAIPTFLSVVNKPKKMKIYGSIVLGIFVVAFLLNLKNGGNRLMKRIANKLILMAVSTTLNFVTFYFIFREEISPTIKIFARNLFS
jgi:hypothetical protein